MCTLSNSLGSRNLGDNPMLLLPSKHTPERTECLFVYQILDSCNSGEASAFCFSITADLGPPLRLELVRLIPVGGHILHSVHGDPQQHPSGHKQLAPANPHVPLQIPPCGSGAHNREQTHAFLQKIGQVSRSMQLSKLDADAHATLVAGKCIED